MPPERKGPEAARGITESGRAIADRPEPLSGDAVEEQEVLNTVSVEIRGQDLVVDIPESGRIREAGGGGQTGEPPAGLPIVEKDVVDAVSIEVGDPSPEALRPEPRVLDRKLSVSRIDHDEPLAGLNAEQEEIAQRVGIEMRRQNRPARRPGAHHRGESTVLAAVLDCPDAEIAGNEDIASTVPVEVHDGHS